MQTSHQQSIAKCCKHQRNWNHILYFRALWNSAASACIVIAGIHVMLHLIFALLRANLCVCHSAYMCVLCYRYPTTTVRLYLAGNNKLVVDSEAILRLDDLDMVLLYKTLCEDPCVVSLDLRYNHITDDGCKYLGLLLAVGSVIYLISHTSVDLSQYAVCMCLTSNIYISAKPCHF